MEHYAKKMLFKGFIVGALVGSAITIHAVMHMAFQMGLMDKEGRCGMMGPWSRRMEGMREQARRKMMMMREHWMGKRGCCQEEEEEEEQKPEEKPEQPEEPRPEAM